jgi:hypothetical protein
VRRERVAVVSKSLEKVEDEWYFGRLASPAVRRDSVETVDIVKTTVWTLATLVLVDRLVDEEVEVLEGAAESEDTEYIEGFDEIEDVDAAAEPRCLKSLWWLHRLS